MNWRDGRAGLLRAEGRRRLRGGVIDLIAEQVMYTHHGIHNTLDHPNELKVILVS